MRPSEIHLAYVPRGVGLACALMYVRRDPNLYGWWCGARGNEMHVAYFMLEAFYSATQTVLYTSEGSDLYGGWRSDLTSGRKHSIAPRPVDPEMTHGLEQAQSLFFAEWLRSAEDRDAEREHSLYREAELAHGAVNPRFDVLNKFDKGSPTWVYYSHGFEAAVLDYLGRRWPLDYAKD